MKQDDMVSAAYAQGRRDQRQSDEALLRKALEAMEYSGMDVGKFNRINAACRALRAALAGHECPNCASLQDQNTELDAKLAELERK